MLDVGGMSGRKRGLCRRGIAGRERDQDRLGRGDEAQAGGMLFAEKLRLQAIGRVLRPSLFVVAQ